MSENNTVFSMNKKDPLYHAAVIMQVFSDMFRLEQLR